MRPRLLSILLLAIPFPVLAVPPAAPSGVVAYAPNEDRVHVSWIDNATDETGFRIERQVDGGAWATLTTVPANFEVYRGTAVSNAEQSYRFRITALKGTEASGATESQVLVKPTGPLDLFSDPGYTDPDPGNTTNNRVPKELPEGSGFRAGSAVNQQILVFNNDTPETFRIGTPESYTVQNIAPGLSLNSTTGAITGTVAAPGVYRMFVGVTFDGGKKFEQVRFLRVLPGVSSPVVDKPINLPKQHLGVKGFLDISTLFKDPARPMGAWFYTAGESIIVALFDTATPKTVNNFLGYVNRGNYNGTLVHRSIPQFIIQGGGYARNSATAPASWREVTKLDPVQNEPGISNIRGTIAMAKLGGTRDSATSEWFFNVDSFGGNPANLNFQNGGFTAFGAVVGTAGQGIVDSINNLVTNAPNDSQNPTNAYLISFPGQSPRPFFDVPVLDPVTTPGPPPQSTAPATLSANSLLPIDSITPCPPVVITLVSNSDPSVLDAGVEGMLLYLESKNKIGTSVLNLKATNLDGNSVNYSLTLNIDDVIGPGFRLTSIRGVNPPGTLLVRGVAQDTIGLGFWRYRINKGRWIKAQTLRGKSASMVARMKGFRRGRNLIEFEVFDARGNRSGVLKQTLTFN
jgi:cyclophilin family peptidyl-prolyl cis-trans isomerase